MQIVGCDLHSRQQTLAILDMTTGEIRRKVLLHEGGNVREFYSSLEGPVQVGIEATGSMQWFLELMEELGIECKVGHPAKIRAAEPRKQKNDKRDAALILKLMMPHHDFPAIWVPSVEQREVRTLLCHRHQLVRLRTQLENALQAIALSHGLRKSRALWSKAGLESLRALSLPPHMSERRETALQLRDHLQKLIDALDTQVSACADNRPIARLLMTHPGVGPITALATETILGDPTRFASAKHLCSYVGLIPADESSAQSLRLGKLTKQGSALLRFLWCEAVGHAVRKNEELKRFYRRKVAQKGMGKAKVAAARKLGVRLWIMMRDNIDYEEFCRRGRQQQGSPSGNACAITWSCLKQ